MSCISGITRPKTASILSLFVPSQNGVIQGSIHYGGGGGSGLASPPRMDNHQSPSRMDNQPSPNKIMESNQPGVLAGDTPVRPKMLGVQSVCKSNKVENHRLPALNLEDDDDDGSLPCTPELPSPAYNEDHVNLSSCPSGAEVLDVETRQLIEVFLREHTGLSVSRCSRNQSKSLSTMKRVVADVIDKHRLAYNGMISKLDLDERGDDMSFLTSVARQIFNDGTTNWGRIVSLVAFGAVVCQHQKNSGHEHCVELVGQEISTYLLSDQRAWMVKNNAWDGFTEFFRVADPESTVRNTLMAFAGVAGIGATLALLIR